MKLEIDSNFTQKDLMLHLLDASQHAVTREELSEVKNEIISSTNKRFEYLETKIATQGEKLEAKIDAQTKRHDKLIWGLFAGMLAIFFKDYLLQLFL